MGACTHNWIPLEGEMGQYVCTQCEVHGHRGRDAFNRDKVIIPYADKRKGRKDPRVQVTHKTPGQNVTGHRLPPTSATGFKD